MYIERIEMDGFKSYAQRTSVVAFDAQFNAITGLNGSGKSNILDAICFVLGITNLSQVRAKQMQDLVYKQGQAGVNKANVNIVFNNTDAEKSPLGYHDYNEITIRREIVVGGKNKYWINGSVAQASRVADLFRSVQLNVNNPHFLIMQGHITKVLNMRPREVLSMIEEAAGTKMYDTKKQQALSTIVKKQKRLDDINAVCPAATTAVTHAPAVQMLKDEIGPEVVKLKMDRAKYLEYQKLQGKLQTLEKLYVAFRYHTGESCKEASTARRDELDTELARLEELIGKNKRRLAELDAQMERIKAQCAVEKGEQLARIEKSLQDAKKVKAQLDSALNAARADKKDKDKQMATKDSQLDRIKADLVTKQEELNRIMSTEGANETKGKELDVALEKALARQQAIAQGLVEDEQGKLRTLTGQKNDLEGKRTSANTEITTAKLELAQRKPRLEARRRERTSDQHDYAKVVENCKQLEDEIAAIEAELGQLNFVEGSDEPLRAEARQLTNEIGGAKRRAVELCNKHYQLSFEYRDPERNFDRSRVKGVVAKLCRVMERKYALALEIAGGGTLANVVVDSEQTGKALLTNGALKKRHTFIPLNKIRPNVIAADKVRASERLVGDDAVHLALDLVHFEPALRGAMEHVFGRTLVCDTDEHAKQVTFSNVSCPTVTLDGNNYNPGGTLTGGWRGRDRLLDGAQELSNVEAAIATKTGRLRDVEQELARLRPQRETFDRLRGKLEAKQLHLAPAKARLQGTAQHRNMAEVEQLQRLCDELDAVVVEKGQEVARLDVKIADLAEKEKNAEAYRKEQEGLAKKQVAEAKKAVGAFKLDFEETAEKLRVIRASIVGLNTDTHAAEAGAREMRAQMDAIEAKIGKATEDADKAAAGVAEIDARLTEQLVRVQRQEAQLQAREDERRQVDEQTRAADLTLNERTDERAKTDAELTKYRKFVEELKRKNDWIESEKHLFGRENSAFDFREHANVDACKQALEAMRGRHEELAGQINAAAMNMLDEAVKQEAELVAKKAQVVADKTQLEDSIKDLDEKKNKQIVEAYGKIDKDFGSVFTMLLPGAQARLQPPAGKSPLDGLEVNVGFGGVWKESLGELSGGQRSLVALSLVLAMLKFRPAPIYMLDEIDAALDLSHTQNIGQMIRTHFGSSQFIVVSLKDGMFNNANVLFKTRFVDGCSTVSRHDNMRSSNKENRR